MITIKTLIHKLPIIKHIKELRQIKKERQFLKLQRMQIDAHQHFVDRLKDIWDEGFSNAPEHPAH